jgi:hypothetical protein
VFELLIAAAAVANAGAFQAPECRVGFERHEEARLVLRLRPSCTLGYRSTHEAVRALLAQEGDARELSLAFGRIERYPWLSSLLARQASSSRRWDPRTGKPYTGSDNAYVAAALRGMPEFTAMFDRWLIAGVSVEKVLTKAAAELPLPAGAPLPPDSKLPYDAIVWVTIRRP